MTAFEGKGQLGAHIFKKRDTHVPDFFKKRSLFWSENFKNFVSGF